MNDAYAHVMQVQMRQDNTWGVTGCSIGERKRKRKNL
jgi:hypothetical protein